MYYIVDDDRDEEGHRFIRAAFSRRTEAEEFTGNIGGVIVTMEDGGDVPELVKAWEASDFSRQARVEAGQILGTLHHDLGNVPTDRAELVEQYADTDPLCELVATHLRELAELKASVNDAIPAEATTFYGVHVRGEWKPSSQAEPVKADA